MNRGRTNLIEELGRVEAESPNRNRRDEVSRIHSELNQGYKKGGRENEDLFVKNRNLQCRTVELFRVKTDYYYDETKIWEFNPPRLDPEKNVKNYPHRFKFEKESILDLENINIYKLTLPSKRLLHKLPYVALSDGKSDILVDLISKSKKN